MATILGDDELARILRDDCPFADITTDGLSIGNVPAHARLTREATWWSAGQKKRLGCLSCRRCRWRCPARLGLSDYVLVFDEHHALLDAGKSLAEHFADLKRHSPERRLAAEASTIADALMLANAGAEIVQVDKMSPEQVAELNEGLSRIAMRPLLASAGGINAFNAAAYAAAGADILVTSSPYYAPPRDVKVSIARA